MNCEQCKQHLLEYAYGELSPELHRQVSEALEQCPECREELAHVQTVQNAVRESMPSEELPHLARANILRQARLHADTQHMDKAPLWDRFASLLTNPAFASAAVIALVAVFSIIVFEFDEPSFQHDAPSLAAKNTAPDALPPRGDAFVPQAAERDKTPLAVDSETLANTPTPAATAKPAIQRGGVEKKRAPAAPQAEEVYAQDEKTPRRNTLSDLLSKKGNKSKPTRIASKAAPSPKSQNLELAKKDNKEALSKDWSRNNSVADAAMDNTLAENQKAKEQTPAEEKSKEDRKNLLAEQQRYALGSPPTITNNVWDNNNVWDKTNAEGMGRGAAGQQTNRAASSAGSASARNQIPPIDNNNRGYEGNRGYGGLDTPAQTNTAQEEANTPTPNEHYNDALSRYNRGDYAGAVQGFNNFINEAPRSSNYHALALYHRGKSLYHQNRSQEAIASFRKVIEDHPQSEKRAEARYWLAKSLLRLNPKDQEAQAILTDLSQGRTGVAENASQELNRAFSRKKYEKAPPKAKPRNKRKATPAKPSPSKGRSMDFQESEEKTTF